MEFQQVIRRRRMVRSFQNRPLSQETIGRILANAQRGPSAGFTQGFEFLVLSDRDSIGCFWDATFTPEARAAFSWPGVFSAPLIIVPLAHKQAYFDRYAEPDKAAVGRQNEADWPAPMWIIDTAFAALLILLTAVDAALGGFFFSIRDDDALRAAFGIPDSFDPIGAIAIGYPEPDRSSSSLARGRRPPESVMHFQHW